MGKKMPNKDQSGKQISARATSSSRTITKFLFIAAVLGALSSYYVFKIITTPPELPEFDINQWWGPYPIDQNPDTSIQPFRVEFSDIVVNDLRERLLHRRPFVDPLEDAGFSYGFNSNFLTRVLDYWQNSYSFKDRENYFNKYSHYRTKIQGLDIHYLIVTPKKSDDVEIVPLLLLHGWPGSFREFYELIPKLTSVQPERNFVFEVIIPSLPGFGYSQAPSRPGFGPVETAVVIRNLMKRLGYSQYYVQGGSAGHVVGATLASLFPREVLGFHTNFPVMLGSRTATVLTLLGSFWPSLVVEQEVQNRMYPLKEHITRYLEESGYMHLQATKPDTIGIALTDTPAGLAAYILEKFSTWTNPDFKKAKDGGLLDKYQLTHLLDNLMVYWTTNTITSSMRMYSEFINKKTCAMRLDDLPVEVPTWGLKFKNDIFFTPDYILRLKYKNYLQSTMVNEGGHFGAFEMPDVMAIDIYEAVDTFREFNMEQKSSKSPRTDPTVYDFTVKDLNGKEVKLDKYKGYLLLIVNVASQCGLTDTNYKELSELYDKYMAKGLRILAFPCNQFGGQEPGSPEEIFKVTRSRGVKFDVFEKIDVNGDNTHPLWQYLKMAQPGTIGDFIKWNFSKFIVDRNGRAVERFAPTVNPMELESHLIKYL